MFLLEMPIIKYFDGWNDAKIYCGVIYDLCEKCFKKYKNNVKFK